MVQWTNEQQQAICERDTNLLVAAGAGAGKTAVLVERVIGRITEAENPVDVDRLLVVTFTNAAAAEMRERVGQALTDKLANMLYDHGHGQEPLERDRVVRQLALLGKASITTIHSFCLEVLRQHFYELDLDPSFRIADENEAALIRIDVLEALLERHYTEPDDAFMALVEGFGGKNDDSTLQELILRLSDYAHSQPWPQQWLEGLAQSFCRENYAHEAEGWYREVKEVIELHLRIVRESLRDALNLSGMEDGPEQYSELLGTELSMVEDAVNCLNKTWDELREAVKAISFERLPSKRQGDVELRERAKGLRDVAKGIVKDKLGDMLHQSEEELRNGLLATAPMVIKLVALTQEFIDDYGMAKKGRGLTDFSDLEHLCLRALRGTDGQPTLIARELQAKYVEILADEYQDINGVQEAILRAICHVDNSFMVGDVKQSIYRFRLADPFLFLEKYKSFKLGLGGGKAIDLASNFRSRPSIIHGVNFLFRQLMTEAIGEMEYDEAAELRAGADYPEHSAAASAAIEVMLIDRDVDPHSEEAQEDALDTCAREARAVGQKILQLVDAGEFQIYDRHLKAYRTLQYRDVVVLLRAARSWSEVFAEEFRRLGIPVYAETATGYFAATEVHTVMSLLRVIDNPYQDIPLAAVLRSPIVGLGGRELAEIRLALPSGLFYQAVQEAALDEGELGQKLRAFMDNLTRWRRLSRRGSLPSLIWRLYRETGYYLFVGATPGGKQRQANLQALYDRACQYERTAFRGLFRFLRFIERLQDNDGDLGTARSLGETEDVVRIMTIHKSKGLEFPVVFVAGMGKQFNMGDLRRAVLIHKKLGLGPYAVDLELRNRYPTLPRLAISHRLHMESLSEELRILYVALTRPREKLYLVGSVAKLDRKLAYWRSVAEATRAKCLPIGILATARSFLDWVGPAMFRHRDLGALSADREDPSAFKLLGEEVIDALSLEFTGEVEGAEVVLEDSLRDEVATRLGWVYPWHKSAGKSVKASVTELKRRQIQEEVPSYRFLPVRRRGLVTEDHSLSRAQVGSAVHLMMLHVDLTRKPTEAYLWELKDNMVQQKLLTVSESESINVAMLVRFFESPLAERLLASPRVWRELPFSLMIPAEEVHGATCIGEQVLIQGVIDCLFSEGDDLVLVDFKTDRIAEDRIDQLLASYEPQIRFYRRAVEQLFRKKIKESYLYLLALGRAVRI